MAQADDGRKGPGGLAARLRTTFDVVVREVAKFGVVGAVAFVVDIGVYNLLCFAGPDGQGLLWHKPLTAKVISVAVATLCSWLGNRYWTFRHRNQPGKLRELVLFGVMNACGLLIALACLGFTVYVLGLRSPLAQNVSGNGVGLVLGTAFRFYAYRTFVFVRPAADVPSAAAAATTGDEATAEGPTAGDAGAGITTATDAPSAGAAHVHDVGGRERGATGHAAR
ncbi:putative flippase GtrA [Kineococcus xinjiangensis]|uniref:Putative flippase GtrA n=1 Tax=Kineococcus xinjiangensis TaxID=512762 RepID=A0A2S6ITZ1_9ACTN|nr:GtrA family protein [Kineococcus xinjiangensis]PPK97713.1 putative flippase GtrA [Kineococcus xinjiangensis]